MINHDLSIVIPAFKDPRQLKQCLQALYQSSFIDFNIIVVDHSESGEITEWVTSDFPRVICLQADTDLWWTGATNIGIKYAVEAGCRLIMPLNHDCYVHRETIEKLLQSFESVTNSILAPVQYSLRERKELVCAGSCFLLGFPTLIFPGKLCRIFSRGSLSPTGLIIGGRGALIEAEMFKTFGYFDEKALPHYGADHDFYLRCKKNGIKLLTCLHAVVDVDDKDINQGVEQKSSSGKEYVSALTKRSSHRNVKDARTLFARYYPVPGLAAVGVVLYLARYSLIHFLRSTMRFFRRSET